MSVELALSLTLKLRPRLRRGKERTEDITEPQTIFHGYNQSEFHRFHTCMCGLQATKNNKICEFKSLHHSESLTCATSRYT